MRTFRTPNRRQPGWQRGQAVVLLAGLLAVLGGMAALAVDLSSYIADRRDLQNDADAMALAGSLDLPSSSEATAAAEAWGEKNNIEDGEIEEIQIVPQNIPSEPNPKVKVTLTREHSFTFARLIGISSSDVSTTATAIKTSASGGDGMIPLSVTEDALAGVGLGEQVVLKFDANTVGENTGNTSPIRIDNSGNGSCLNSEAWCAGMMDGAENVLCVDGVGSEYCTGASTVDTQPGVVVGSTRLAVNCRLYDTNEPAWPGTGGDKCGDDPAIYTDNECDTFAETFEDDPTSLIPGEYRITPECNPFIDGGYSSNRVLIIPVIDELPNGSSDQVTIVDFALFFLEGFAPGTNCRQGNTCEIVGTYVRVNQNIGLLAGTFDPLASNSFVRLVE